MTCLLFFGNKPHHTIIDLIWVKPFSDLLLRPDFCFVFREFSVPSLFYPSFVIYWSLFEVWIESLHYNSHQREKNCTTNWYWHSPYLTSMLTWLSFQNFLDRKRGGRAISLVAVETKLRMGQFNSFVICLIKSQSFW